MRLPAALVCLALPALAGDVLLTEARAWRGTIEVRALSASPADGSGREEQRERIEFLLDSKPPGYEGATEVAVRTLEASGRWEVLVALREKEHATRGGGSGALYPRLSGELFPAAGRYRLRVDGAPKRLAARSTLSGVDGGRFQTFRTVTSRPSYLASFVAEGHWENEGRLLRGSKSFTDKKQRYPREVTISWRIERIDPVVKGRVLDHRGEPVAGVEVEASMTNRARLDQRLPPLRRKATTDAHGRFEIEAFLAVWGVKVKGAARDGVVHGVAETIADVRFDKNTDLELKIPAYRLAALPHARLLRDYFEGDVERFLAYVGERASPARLERALVSPPGE